MFITSNQGRPIQGVSQQPEKTRLPGQCTLSENLRPDIVKGLINRPGTEAVSALLTAPTSTNVKWYHYSRGTGEQYFIAIESNGVIRAWSPDGTQHIINISGNPYTYLASDNPIENLNLLTIGDYTFILNKTVPVMQSPTLSPAKTHQSIVYVQFADYGQFIEIYIDSTRVALYTLATGHDDSDTKLINTLHIAYGLEQALHGIAYNGDREDYSGVDITGDFDVVREDNCIYINRKDGADYILSVNDSANGANTIGIKDKLKDTSMLPGRAPEGFVIKIDPPGSSEKDNTSYYLKAENTLSNHITWRETIKPGIALGFDKSTMPHVLIRESIDESGVATFLLKEGEWKDREVGDDNTNPLPTFVNNVNPIKINSIGMFQNRLFFTASESVIMSGSSDFFNFYRTTAQVALDTEPIDIYADVPEINYLKTNISYNGDLLFFSKLSQFILDGSKPITKKIATLRKVTSFEAQLSVPPVASGDAIFFAFSYGQYTGVKEFFTDSITDTKKARPITDHVKKYIKGVPELMATSTDLNTLIIKTDQDPNVLYVYDWLWQGTDKVQSAWGKFVFEDNAEVHYFEFIEEVLYVVISRFNIIWIEKIDLGDPPDDALNFPVRLDRMIHTQLTYDSVNEKWISPDIYIYTPDDNIMCIRSTGAYPADMGTPINITRVDQHFETEDNLNAGSTVQVIFGTKMICKYTPTNPVALDRNGYAMNLDRLTVGAYYMNYDTSGAITAKIEQTNGTVRNCKYINRVLGGEENLVGFAPLTFGQHRVPIRQKSDRYVLTFETDSYLPLEVRDFEYNGDLNRRGLRL